MGPTQAEIEVGARALLDSVIGQTLHLRDVEARKIAELVIEAADQVPTSGYECKDNTCPHHTGHYWGGSARGWDRLCNKEG